MEESSLLQIPLDDDDELVVFGDTHGCAFEVLHVLQ